MSSEPVNQISDDHQAQVAAWMLECFGPEITKDKTERADRFVEEALELAQAIGWTADRGHALVDYVFGRPVGEVGQEVGGVMVTLAALCNVFEIDINAEAKREVDRITKPEIVLKIRAKQAAKPTGSALPVALALSPKPLEITEEMVELLAKFITEECYGYSWDGLRQDGRVTDRGFKTFRYDSFGGKAIQGTQNDLRDVARNAFAALQGETK